MPKKPKFVRLPITIHLPRNAESISTVVEIDPSNLGLSDSPTVKEIEAVARNIVHDKLKVKLGTDGRSAIAAIKEARKANAQL